MFNLHCLYAIQVVKKRVRRRDLIENHCIDDPRSNISKSCFEPGRFRLRRKTAVVQLVIRRGVLNRKLCVAGVLIASYTSSAIVIRHDIANSKYQVHAAEFPALVYLPEDGASSLRSSG